MNVDNDILMNVFTVYIIISKIYFRSNAQNAPALSGHFQYPRVLCGIDVYFILGVISASCEIENVEDVACV